MLFVIHCIDKPDSQDLRLKTRPRHLEYLQSQAERVLLAGPTLTDDGTGMTGSVLIVEAADRAAAEAFADGDPYSKAGLFAGRSIAPWRKVVLNPGVGA